MNLIIYIIKQIFRIPDKPNRIIQRKTYNINARQKNPFAVFNRVTGAIVAAIRAYSWLAGQTGLENIEIIPTPKYSYPSTFKIPFKYFFYEK